MVYHRVYPRSLFNIFIASEQVHLFGRGAATESWREEWRFTHTFPRFTGSRYPNKWACSQANIFLNDLWYVIEKSTLSTYDDDIQIFYTDNELSKVEETISNDLISADIWFARSGLKRNSSKYQAMVLRKNKGTDEPVFKC